MPPLVLSPMAYGRMLTDVAVAPPPPMRLAAVMLPKKTLAWFAPAAALPRVPVAALRNRKVPLLTRLRPVPAFDAVIDPPAVLVPAVTIV